MPHNSAVQVRPHCTHQTLTPRTTPVANGGRAVSDVGESLTRDPGLQERRGLPVEARAVPLPEATEQEASRCWEEGRTLWAGLRNHHRQVGTLPLTPEKQEPPKLVKTVPEEQGTALEGPCLGSLHGAKGSESRGHSDPPRAWAECGCTRSELTAGAQVSPARGHTEGQEHAARCIFGDVPSGCAWLSQTNMGTTGASGPGHG